MPPEITPAAPGTELTVTVKTALGEVPQTLLPDTEMALVDAAPILMVTELVPVPEAMVKPEGTLQLNVDILFEETE